MCYSSVCECYKTCSIQILPYHRHQQYCCFALFRQMCWCSQRQRAASPARRRPATSPACTRSRCWWTCPRRTSACPTTSSASRAPWWRWATVPCTTCWRAPSRWRSPARASPSASPTSSAACAGFCCYELPRESPPSPPGNGNSLVASGGLMAVSTDAVSRSRVSTEESLIFRGKNNWFKHWDSCCFLTLSKNYYFPWVFILKWGTLFCFLWTCDLNCNDKYKTDGERRFSMKNEHCPQWRLWSKCIVFLFFMSNSLFSTWWGQGVVESLR